MAQPPPYLKIYPGDWYRSNIEGCDLDVQMCWMRILWLMMETEEYGVLVIKNEPFSDEFLAKKLKISRKKLQNFLKILEKHDVFKRDERGAIYSGRMIADARERQLNGERQKIWYDKHKANSPDENQKPNAPLTKYTCASSSSSSMSLSEEEGEEKEEKKGSPIGDAKEEKKSARPEKAPAKPKPMPPAYLTEDFEITDEMRKWAAENAPYVPIEKTTEGFIEYWVHVAPRIAKNRRTPRGWLATWKARFRFLTEKIEEKKAANGNGNRQQTPGEIIASRDYRSEIIEDGTNRGPRAQGRSFFYK